METKIVCSKCKSDNIMLRYWYNPNTNQHFGWDEDEQCYCNECKELTFWEEKQFYRWEIQGTDFVSYEYESINECLEDMFTAAMHFIKGAASGGKVSAEIASDRITIHYGNATAIYKVCM